VTRFVSKKEMIKKTSTKDGESNNHEIDYLGKMKYFDNAKFYTAKYGKFKFEKPAEAKIKELEAQLDKHTSKQSAKN
jgi:hypothetical protein